MNNKQEKFKVGDLIKNSNKENCIIVNIRQSVRFPSDKVAYLFILNKKKIFKYSFFIRLFNKIIDMKSQKQEEFKVGDLVKVWDNKKCIILKIKKSNLAGYSKVAKLFFLENKNITKYHYYMNSFKKIN